MDLASRAPDPPASEPSGSPSPPPGRTLAALADRAGVFARTPPREKAALLRASLPRVLALAPDMVAHACDAAGVDPQSPLAATAWLAGPVAWLAGVRSFAQALEDIAACGRPVLLGEDLRGRLAGKVLARLTPPTFAERLLHGDADAGVLFAEGVAPEDVIAGQAAFYRARDPAGGVARVTADGGPPAAAPLAALHALFVEGKVVTVETSAAWAWLGPLIERGLAPLVDAGFLQVAQGDAAADAVRGEAVAGGPVIVVPAFYALDELWFVARRLASEIAAGAAFDVAAPREIVLAGGWAPRRLFLEQLQRALAALPPQGAPWTLVPDPSPTIDLPAGSIGVLTAGWDDPVEMLAAAVPLCNARLRGEATAEIVAHVLHEEDAEVAAAIARAVAQLRHVAVGVNQWPALLALHGDAPWGARAGAKMLARVDKAVLQGPLRSARRPAYFYDARGAVRRCARIAAFHASPSVGAILRGARV